MNDIISCSVYLILEGKNLNRKEIYNRLNLPYNEALDILVEEKISKLIHRTDVKKILDRIVILFYKEILKFIKEKSDDGSIMFPDGSEPESFEDVVTKFNWTKNKQIHRIFDEQPVVFDFLNSEMRTNQYSFDWSGGNLQKLIALANQFHLDLENKIKEYTPVEKEFGKILFHTGNYYWIDLEKPSCAEEGKAMGHCGTGQVKGTLYSLRERVTINGIEYVKRIMTADVQDRTITEVKGKANSKPDNSLYSHFMALFYKGYVDILRTNQGFRHESNIRISDLSDKDVKFLVELNVENIFSNLSIIDSGYVDNYLSNIDLDELDENEIFILAKYRYVEFEDLIKYTDNLSNSKIKTLYDERVISKEDILKVIDNKDKLKALNEYIPGLYVVDAIQNLINLGDEDFLEEILYYDISECKSNPLIIQRLAEVNIQYAIENYKNLVFLYDELSSKLTDKEVFNLLTRNPSMVKKLTVSEDIVKTCVTYDYEGSINLIKHAFEKYTLDFWNEIIDDLSDFVYDYISHNIFIQKFSNETDSEYVREIMESIDIDNFDYEYDKLEDYLPDSFINIVEEADMDELLSMNASFMLRIKSIDKDFYVFLGKYKVDNNRDSYFYIESLNLIDLSGNIRSITGGLHALRLRMGYQSLSMYGLVTSKGLLEEYDGMNSQELPPNILKSIEGAMRKLR
jgi:hypothetical protein